MTRWIIEIGTMASVEVTVHYTGSQLGATRKARRIARQTPTSRTVDVSMLDETNGRPCRTLLSLQGAVDVPDHDEAHSAVAALDGVVTL